jgi:hypothetical protein
VGHRLQRDAPGGAIKGASETAASGAVPVGRGRDDGGAVLLECALAMTVPTSSEQAPREPWVQRFELQSAVAAALCTLLGVWLLGTEKGAPIGEFALRGAYVWALISIALGLVFAVVRARNGTGAASGFVALALGAATFAYHLTLPS